MGKGQISVFLKAISLVITVVFLLNCSGVRAQENIPTKRILPANALANSSEFQSPEVPNPPEVDEQAAEEAEGFGLPAPVLMIAFSLPSLGEKLRNIKIHPSFWVMAALMVGGLYLISATTSVVSIKIMLIAAIGVIAFGIVAVMSLGYVHDKVMDSDKKADPFMFGILPLAITVPLNVIIGFLVSDLFLGTSFILGKSVKSISGHLSQHMNVVSLAVICILLLYATVLTLIFSPAIVHGLRKRAGRRAGEYVNPDFINSAIAKYVQAVDLVKTQPETEQNDLLAALPLPASSTVTQMQRKLKTRIKTAFVNCGDRNPGSRNEVGRLLQGFSTLLINCDEQGYDYERTAMAITHQTEQVVQECLQGELSQSLNRNSRSPVDVLDQFLNDLLGKLNKDLAKAIQTSL